MIRAWQLRFVAADRLELARFDDAQQAGLVAQAQHVDLIEQNRPFPGGRELADDRAVGTGEGTPHMSEQRALDQVFGQGAAGDHEEWLLAPRRRLVQRAGQVGLARARFAGQQRDRVVGGGQDQMLDERQERRRLLEQLGVNRMAVGALVRFRGPSVAALELVQASTQSFGIFRPAEQAGHVGSQLGQFSFSIRSPPVDEQQHRRPFLEPRLLDQAVHRFRLLFRPRCQDPNAAESGAELAPAGGERFQRHRLRERPHQMGSNRFGEGRVAADEL